MLAAAAAMPGVQALACEGLGAPTEVPSGLPVHPVDGLPDALDVDEVVLVPCERTTAYSVGAWAAQRGIPSRGRLPDVHPAPAGIRVIAVSSASTGSGKTAAARRIARALRGSGVSVAVARHPISNLLLWGRFGPVVVRAPDELHAGRPLEEREELAPLVGAGVAVVTGLDPESVLRTAAREAGEGGVVLWDGGGAAAPWVEPAVHVVAVDLLRPPSEDRYGRVASADVVVLTKADSATPQAARETETRVREWNPTAAVVLADLTVGAAPVGVLADRAVVCVEDWSSLVTGGLRGGAGTVAARRFRCGMVDPRPFAVGAIRAVLGSHDHIGPVIPSLGRTPGEIADLAASVAATPGEVVLWASNADPRGVIPDERRPVVRAYGELSEVSGPSLQEVLAGALPGHAS